ncbi:MAG: lamin tail domain-containing protein [Planctomycetota bacterium]
MHKIKIHSLLRFHGVCTLVALAWFALAICAPATGRADTIADSMADWAPDGEQGVNGWTYGYYNRTDDGNNSYAADEFILFESAHWRATGWRLVASNCPWTNITSEGVHPNGTNSCPSEEHWPIRRWTSDRAGALEVIWHTREVNLAGAGVSGRLYHNGELIDSEVIAGGDGAGVTRTLDVTVAVGDVIDLANTPVGPNSNRSDGSDGSANRLTIEDGVDDPDGDGLNSDEDNCPNDANAGQADADGDNVGDACDNCPNDGNANQRDQDRDGLGDACDEAEEAAPRYGVVINEIHYNPQEGADLEFIELYNSGAQAVDMSRWAFTGGIRHEFEQGTVIDSGGFLVICRNPLALGPEFGLVPSRLVLWVGSALNNGGENIELIDATSAVVDSVRYDDDAPWETGADGPGGSLQRLCALFESDNPSNWRGRADETPTPMAVNTTIQCPPPPRPSPAVAINEIMYHTPDNDPEDLREYIELTNTTSAPIDLQGYCFTQGVDFCFEESTVLLPGGYLVVCRDETAARAGYGISNTVGNWDGQLSNDGERITLVNAAGELADSARYGESDDWNVGADGLGFSLEKIVSDAVSDDAASWTDSGAMDGEVPGGGDEWSTVSVSGTATSSRIYIYIQEAGAYLLDNISLVDTRDPDTNLVPGGSFDNGLGDWDARGNHSGSRWSRDGGGERFDEPALHLVSTGRGTGSANSVRLDLPEALDRSAAVTYTLSFSYIQLSGGDTLTARLSVSTASRGVFWQRGGGGGGVISPGAANVVTRECLPPFASNLNRWPQEPTSADWTTLTARVRGEPTEVKLVTSLSGANREIEMLDDGTSNDGAAGDGVYGADVPPQAHNTVVTFKIQARNECGLRVFPPRTDTEDVYAYYVNDNQPDSTLPVITLLTPSANGRSWISGLGRTYMRFSIASRGDVFYQAQIRRRGGSVYSAAKPYLKVKMNKGHLFFGKKRFNFQSLWTDKALVRETMTWTLFDEMDNPALSHELFRLHANGVYHALYAVMENPEERWLDRVGLNADGNLYKATASREERNGTYEKKTNQHEDYSDLRTFLNELHDTPRNQLTDFFIEKTVPDTMIDYQAGQVLINNRDYPHKNHYLYHDTETGRWIPTGWDLDLAYGKRWDGGNGGVYNDRMDNPGMTIWNTTSVRGGGTGNHLLDKFFSQSGSHFRRAYLVRLWGAIHEKYTLDFYEQRLADFSELLVDEQQDDFNAWGRTNPAGDRSAPAGFAPNIERVMAHIRSRRSYMVNYLRNTERFTGFDRMMITEVMYNPLGDDEAEYLEIWNNSGSQLDISGWKVEGLDETGDDGVLQEFFFPDGSNIARDEVVILAKDPAAFQRVYGNPARIFGPYPGSLSNEGEKLRLKDAGPGYPATVDIVRYSQDAPWPPRADGLGYSLELVDVHEDIDNDTHLNWRVSSRLYGSPGSIQRLGEATPSFVRGNCNADQAVDISDAVTILFYLFMGEREPRCLEGCDVNGNREVSIDDAIALLRYLFSVDSFAIPAPAPGGDCAPSEEGSCEISNCITQG